MKISTIKSHIKDKRNLTIISFILLIVFWKILSLIINSGLILPSPENTFISIFYLIKTGEFYIIILSSLKRGLIGFALSLLLGITFGFLAGLNDTINKLLEPVLVIVRSTPLMSVILLALIWFKTENVPIFASFLVSFPIITSNTIEGIKNIDTKIIQMANIYKIKKWRIITEIYFPAILPFTIAAISTS
ncbi:MAG: ABC transporter permease subunit, partial [Actinobacteria bacterium]|nr:ABC transporter permease subunit [Actinomycetota bacterium]